MNKKILYIHQYFVTPDQAGGTRSYWIAKELIRQGYNVVMLTSDTNPSAIRTRKNIDGIDVIYIPNQYDNSYGIIRRLWSFVRFMVISTFVGLKEKDVDVVFATSTPLTIGIPALIIKLIKQTPYIFEVRDLWPEVPIQMGALKNRLLQKLLILFEKIIYNKAAHIVTLSPGMEEGVIKHLNNASKVSMIPNMSKIDKFYKRPLNSDVIKKLNINVNNFNVIHFGTIGIANGVDYIIEAAKLLKTANFDKICFLFAGSGGLENHFRKICYENRLNNVKFLGAFGMEEMTEIVNISDCSIVSFADIPILKTNSPNKLFDSLSAQKPVIVNSSGWTKDLVEEKQCGAYVDPKKPKELVDLLLDWSQNEDKLVEMGNNARKVAESDFDKSMLTPKIVEIVDNLYESL